MLWSHGWRLIESQEIDMQKEKKDGFEENDIRPLAMQEKAQRLFEKDIKRICNRKSEFVTVICPACGAEKFNNYFVKYDLSFVSCEKCETVYINPRPTPEILNDYYSHSELYEFFRTDIFPSTESVRREKIFKPRVERLIDICKQYGVNNDLLIEVGPGFGIFSELVLKKGFFKKVVAVERTPDMAQSCRDKGLEVIEKAIEDVDLGEEKAQVVASFEVIEHLYEPKKFIEKCSLVLEKNGLLILTCPNSQGFDMQVLKELSHTYDAEHLNYFNPDSLSNLLEQCGFDVLEVLTPGALDAELVREKLLSGERKLDDADFLKKILIDKWEEAGTAFQNFLQQARMSSHMWIVAKRR